MEELIKLFDSVMPLSVSDKQLLLEHLYEELVPKKTRYHTSGSICKKMGFVLEGVFKVERSDELGNRSIQYFTSEGHFAVDLDSFSNQHSSVEDIEALTNCRVVTINSKAYQLFENKIANFTIIISRLKEKALIEKLRIKSEMVTDDAPTKYQKLLLRHPSISQRVAQHEIATYLGITQYTLSRIKRNSLLKESALNLN